VQKSKAAMTSQQSDLTSVSVRSQLVKKT